MPNIVNLRELAPILTIRAGIDEGVMGCLRLLGRKIAENADIRSGFSANKRVEMTEGNIDKMQTMAEKVTTSSGWEVRAYIFPNISAKNATRFHPMRWVPTKLPRFLLITTHGRLRKQPHPYTQNLSPTPNFGNVPRYS